jgi:dCMP deaminase
MDKNIPNWSEYFMEIAKTIAKRSKDENTKVGAVLVDKTNRIIGTGYNGMPTAMNETVELWQRPTKYDYVIHAEMNCILHATRDIKGSKLYVTLFPCKECAKLIASAGITKIVYLDDKSKNEVSDSIFNSCNIHVSKLGVSK